MAEKSQAEALYDKILLEYTANVKKNAGAQRFLAALKSENATSEDVSIYSSDLGDCAAEALNKYLAPEYLPKGKLDWDILTETVDPLMRRVFNSVVDAASEVMRRETLQAGIHINPVAPEYPAERIKALMNSMLIRYDPDNEQ